MRSTTVNGVLAWAALDSRGRPTVGCEVRLHGGARGSATVPSGASTGSHEARELRDGGERYAGMGTSRAVGNVRDVLGPAVIGQDVADQERLDSDLVDLDGTADLGRLGANAVLAVSLAAVRAAAEAAGLPLYRALDPSGARPILPLPMVNVFTGGAHAKHSMDIQDVLVVPVGAVNFPQAIEWAWRVRNAAAALLEARGEPSGLVADEGGLAVDVSSNRQVLELACDAIGVAKLGVGTDVA
ncbi:MAG: phosphopyruvate hydratase, partial [Actinomycetes bacterium]